MASGGTEIRQYRRRVIIIIEEEVITHMQEKLDDVKQMDDVEDAEEELNRACNDIKRNVNDKIDEIRNDVRRRRRDCTTDRQMNDYEILVRAVTQEIDRVSSRLGEVFVIIRNLVRQVIDWIRRHLRWVPDVIRDAFRSIRSLFSD